MGSKRDAYVQKIKGKIDEWNAELDRLSAKADQAEGEARIKYQRQMEELQQKQNDLNDKLEKLKGAGDSAWEELKEGIERSWETWKHSFAKAKSEFKKGYKEGRD
ncbi:hypothetical protein [Desulfonatronovibrio hydrogenovorans]|uniref:hypothetical protein n=1 Tax=Desulfonatronovibrio hydrogenovorans TaxID=53245 RepID=UPI00048E7B69|nr:hypothetical protein [Desulfonatronovibrio hydrogenovorans]